MKQKRKIFQSLGISLVLSFIPLSQVMAAPANGLAIGLGVMSAPRYSGANDNHIMVVPIVNAKYNQFFFDMRRGLGIHLDLPNQFYFEQSLGYRSGRKDSDQTWGNGSDDLKGMGDIDSAWITTSKVGVQFNPRVSLSFEATTALNHDQGINYGPTLSGNLPLNDNWSINASAHWLMATDDYTQTYYGVDSGQSTRSGFARYHTAGGGYGHTLNLTLAKQFSPQLSANILLSYTHLSSKVADSDVVKDDNNLTTGILATYRF
ncbi:MipA/OmpV family protein [Celerinatantimonas diazotrophica]|uniref:Outer membrane scaffolding protein for murein synthesis (MipA/OmpV family) n=1 Tax=Celerinatantimonas diazotrophica TaxID=412034 RepID=A0A4V2PRJ1_9GAMM|nr:MipA/OmpV family protein [Celerinatantimonas diazotrophica]TCK59041.1 outer membrane scaffolding protein for murein synthesis (MipA/OmpV family) [Celerinatantimonas diazotrophica]CAG9297676.1 hypothetical protein CEDIAZO_02865 [Celerinatantimonas diazotrophica]